VLNTLGVDFGQHDRFVDPASHPWNPIFFELRSLNNTNDMIIQEMGGKYMPLSPASIHERHRAVGFLPDQIDFDERVRSIACELVGRLLAEEFKSNSLLIGLKDPRFCFLLPIWDHALREHDCESRLVIVRRSPEAVVRSNSRLNDLPDSWNFMLVANHLMAISTSISCGTFPNHCSLFFEDLLQNPEAVVASISLELGIPTEYVSAAAGMIQNDLNHQSTSQFEASERFRAIATTCLNSEFCEFYCAALRACIAASCVGDLAHQSARLRGRLEESYLEIERLKCRIGELENPPRTLIL
jgi:hypothetical protein